MFLLYKLLKVACKLNSRHLALTPYRAFFYFCQCQKNILFTAHQTISHIKTHHAHKHEWSLKIYKLSTLLLTRYNIHILSKMFAACMPEIIFKTYF